VVGRAGIDRWEVSLVQSLVCCRNVRGSIVVIDQSRSRDSAYKVVDVNGRLRRNGFKRAGSADGRMSRSRFQPLERPDAVLQLFLRRCFVKLDK